MQRLNLPKPNPLKNQINPLLVPLITLKAVAQFLDRRVDEVARYSKQWRDAGILFDKLVGKPPKRYRVVYTYPYLLLKWIEWDNKRYTSQRHARRRSKQDNGSQAPQGIIEYEI